jgi:hypothetical protein
MTNDGKTGTVPRRVRRRRSEGLSPAFLYPEPTDEMNRQGRQERQEGCHSDRSEAEWRNLSGRPQIMQMTQIPTPEEANRQWRQDRQGAEGDCPGLRRSERRGLSPKPGEVCRQGRQERQGAERIDQKSETRDQNAELRSPATAACRLQTANSRPARGLPKEAL